MNCARCNAPLVPEARFCPNCGLTVATAAPSPAIADAAQANQPAPGPVVARSFVPLKDKFIAPAPAPAQPYQSTAAVSPGSLPSTGSWPSSPPLPVRRRKNRVVPALLMLALVLLVFVAGWFFGLRPYLHGLAQSQIDSVLSNAINQINPVGIPLLPPGIDSIPVPETAINNLIVLNTAPSNPVQQMHMTITPAGLRLDFQAYGFPCTVTGVPQASNGQLVITNVTVQGIASLIISPDELTATLNAHLRDASAKLHRGISGVLLKDHEIDVQLR